MNISTGYRYAVELPMGFESAQFVSKVLYRSRGAAIDAAREAYPPEDYPDAVVSVLADEELIGGAA